MLYRYLLQTDRSEDPGNNIYPQYSYGLRIRHCQNYAPGERSVFYRL